MYNESKIIEATARELSEYMSKNFDSYEILFSNDGSKDDCAQKCAALGLPNVRVVGYEVNRGKGCAVREGIMQADGDIIMFTDADLAYGTDVIKRYYDKFEELPDTDMLIGSRNISEDGYEGYTFLRRVMSKIYIKVLCIVGGFKLTDSQCGCKAFRKETAKEIFSRCEVDRFAFDFEVILWAEKLGYTIKEIPVKIINHRESKVNVFKDTFRMLKDLRRIKKNVKKASK
jgi:dolichyl-phosphate beta-glucosyltransferase